MTNNEILQASLLDILFDNRNKNYGAYVLRRNYNHRLLTALAITLSAVALIIVLRIFHKKEPGQLIPGIENGGVIIKPVVIKPEMPIKKETSKKSVRPIEKIAQIKFQNMKIVPDKLAINNLPMISDLDNKIISDKNVVGKPDDGKLKSLFVTNKSNGDDGMNQSSSAGTFIPEERNPEFPGGKEALIRFLKNNLNTPDELQAGDRKTVLIRFKVDTDGSISSEELVQSGGSLFDREVIRVCKRMPRWKPAIQNGKNVAVSYVLPVTFIGVEQ